MANLYLHQDAYICQTDDGVLFMNLATEKYFGLSRPEAAAVATHITGWPIHPDENDPLDLTPVNSISLVDSMLRYGLLTEALNFSKPIECASVDISDAIPYRGTILNPPSVRVVDLFNFLQAYFRTLLELKSRPLAGIVDRVRKRKSRHRNARSQIAVEDVYRLVRMYRLLTPFLYTSKGKCLFDSLALVEFLSRYDCYPTWVIGMRTRPFGAHSWVQHESLVLNEKLESVEEFSPILVV